jgi:hypothetical protein
MRKLLLIVLLVAVAVGAWYLRGRFESGPPTNGDTAVASASPWQPITPEGAARAKRALDGLGQPRGPVFASLAAGDLASYIYESLKRQLPPSADSIEAAVIDSLMYVRASVSLDELGGQRVLGPLAGMLGGRERLQMGGTFEILRPGLAQFRIRAVRLGNFNLPERVIPRLLRAVRRGSLPEGVADDALPLVVPAYLAETRISQGKVVVYKNVP